MSNEVTAEQVTKIRQPPGPGHVVERAFTNLEDVDSWLYAQREREDYWASFVSGQPPNLTVKVIFVP